MARCGLFMLLRTGKAGPLLKPAQYLRGLLPQSHDRRIGRQGRGLLTAAGRACGLHCVTVFPRSIKSGLVTSDNVAGDPPDKFIGARPSTFTESGRFPSKAFHTSG